MSLGELTEAADIIANLIFEDTGREIKGQCSGATL